MANPNIIGATTISGNVAYSAPANTSANSLVSNVGPNGTPSNATWNADDPWTDGKGSVTFTGQTNSYMQFAGSSIFALDV